jgi:hypothetical protein
LDWYCCEQVVSGCARRTMKCTGGRESRFLVCLQVLRPSPVISAVLLLMKSVTQLNGDHSCHSRFDSALHCALAW